MHIESYDPGVPSWVDVATPDVAQACEFYGALFGWDIAVGSPEFGGYATASVGGRSVAGISPQQQPGPSYWSTYVNVASADETVAKVTEHGGTVFFPPMDVSDLGRMSVFSDPAGAVLGIWQPGAMKGAGLVNEPGGFGWNELMTTDTEGSKAFYGAVFGWGSHTHEAPGMPGGYTEWQVDGRSVGGMMGMPPGLPAGVPPNWGVYFIVTDTDATAAKAQELGGRLNMGPRDIPQGRIAVLSDPAGAVFSILTMGQGTGAS